MKFLPPKPCNRVIILDLRQAGREGGRGFVVVA